MAQALDLASGSLLRRRGVLRGAVALAATVLLVGAPCALGVAGAPSDAAAALAGAPDVRITKGFGTKGYDQIRVSVITNTPEPPVADFFDYSAQFVHRWTQFYLHTAMKTLTPGAATPLPVLGADISVRLPLPGAGVAGALIADPCVPDARAIVSCDHGQRFQTYTRIPELIDAFVGGPDADFWSISGDNFYDRYGNLTADVFARISGRAKAKIFNTVPGNHDFWARGSPWQATADDQCSNGFMQFYGQDTKSAEQVGEKSAHAPYDFSRDPSAKKKCRPRWWKMGCSLPVVENFVWYHQLGNLGLLGQSGAHSIAESRPHMREACAWFAQQPELHVVLLFGHWDVPGEGSSPFLVMPIWYEEMTKVDGCREYHERGMLKFVMGHTHCNDPHPHGQVGAGFRVAGFGKADCTHFGMPMVDTTAGRVRFWYFNTKTDSLYNSVISCIREMGTWRACTHLATVWLDEPIRPKPTSELVV